MKLSKKDQVRLNTCLNRLLDGEDGIYIPERVKRSDKLTFEQKQLYGLLCMLSSTTGIVANGDHLVFILDRLVPQVVKDLERLKQLGYIAPVIRSIGFCKYEITDWNILTIQDVEQVKRQMIREVYV